MVQHDVAPREEVLGDERHAAGVRREDRRPGRRGPVVAGVRASRLAVDDAGGARSRRSAGRPRPGSGTGRARDAPARRRPGPPSALRARSRRGRASAHRGRPSPSGSVSGCVGNVRARTVTAPAASAPPFFAALGRVTRQPIGPGRTSRSMPDQRRRRRSPLGNSASGRPSHSARTSGGAPVTCRSSTSPGCGLGGVTDTRTPPWPAAAAAAEPERGRRRPGTRGGCRPRESGPSREPSHGRSRRAPGHSGSGVGPGGCWRRKRSISATRSFALGRSPAGGGSASSAS